jgi:hypothetical protein
MRNFGIFLSNDRIENGAIGRIGLSSQLNCRNQALTLKTPSRVNECNGDIRQLPSSSSYNLERALTKGGQKAIERFAGQGY